MQILRTAIYQISLYIPRYSSTSIRKSTYAPPYPQILGGSWDFVGITSNSVMLVGLVEIFRVE